MKRETDPSMYSKQSFSVSKEEILKLSSSLVYISPKVSILESY